MSGVILIIIGIILICINLKAVKNDDSFDSNFENQLKNTKDYDLKIGTIRKEFAETILEMQQEIQELKYNIDTYKKEAELGDNKKVEYLEKKNDILVSKSNIHKDLERKDLNVKDDNNNIQSAKVSKVKKMFQDGYSVDDISEKLNLGKGEVLLIQKLYTN
ncbi:MULTISPECIES: DUF6115 domain-containing protein [Clostridium]|uniref:DUF6115 domain-containing protein n=1 Tax=Clostridium TaxID=1485 RepID=UPI0008244E41|nr:MULTISPECIES: hypothetical protein [Clostridium]PJI09883.1 hypothetical protein CUB90_19305 [Clostridium sp. CT7]